MSIHPTQQQLKLYSEGALSDVDGFAIALHLEQCSECKAQVAELEAASATAIFDQEATVQEDTEVGQGIEDSQSETLQAMLADITSLEIEVVAEPAEQRRDPIKTVTTPNGKEFTLPKGLGRHVDRIGAWRNYGGKIYSATVELDTYARINLLYINEDAQVPQHTHKGQETTVILHGGFSDEDGHYHAGDYLARDASHKHSPYTKVGEDCLCLTVLTEPMVFTQGVARVFNLFGKGMFP
ncbi:ChrR family anti-sigma-E factor [Vibrio sp. WXL210]|uniref:ChrR family anti-sigma-E factor n=1 Tax=Vibrio sp. WXL210 TaxID=3450709 RepID=UPI003EC88E71